MSVNQHHVIHHYAGLNETSMSMKNMLKMQHHVVLDQEIDMVLSEILKWISITTSVVSTNRCDEEHHNVGWCLQPTWCFFYLFFRCNTTSVLTITNVVKPLQWRFLP